MRADELMKRLIAGELINYSVVRTSPEPLQYLLDSAVRFNNAKAGCSDAKAVVEPVEPCTSLAVINVYFVKRDRLLNTCLLAAMS
jgi:hypothetical protein